MRIIDRRQADAPDIVLGHVSLWIGSGEGMSWPWLDVAVRIGEGWERMVDVHGALVQRPDFLAFVPDLRGFAERRRAEARLASLGGSLRLLLARSDYGWLRGEMLLLRGALSQTIAFPLREEQLPPALAGAEAVAARLAGEDLGWHPNPARLGLSETRLPRESLVAPPPPPPSLPAKAWDAGLGDGEEVELEYTHDGYGWYAVQVRVGGKVGEFGGGYLTDPMGDLLRAALLLLADAPRSELVCNAEPGLTRVSFEEVVLGDDVAADGGFRRRYGCRIEIRDLGPGGSPEGALEFSALCRSPRAVAEAIYLMALPHFRDGAGPWSAPMAALEAALAAVPEGG